MFEKMVDDLKGGLRRTVQATVLVGVGAVAAVLALCFLYAAAFVFVRDRYGLIEACLAGGGLFLVIAIVFVICYVVLSRRSKRQAEQAKAAARAKAAAQPALDPMVVAAGIQIVRAIGIKRLGPLLAIAGLAVSALAISSSRAKRGDHDAKQ
jgi:uncharacterized membrane protein